MAAHTARYAPTTPHRATSGVGTTRPSTLAAPNRLISPAAMAGEMSCARADGARKAIGTYTANEVPIAARYSGAKPRVATMRLSETGADVAARGGRRTAREHAANSTAA